LLAETDRLTGQLINPNLRIVDARPPHGADEVRMTRDYKLATVGIKFHQQTL
jgi:hypothetical protein